MPRYIFFALIASVLSGKAFSEHANPNIFGKWEVTAVLDFTPVTSADAVRESARIRGEYLLISPGDIRFKGVDCPSPSLAVRSETTFKYFYIQYGGFDSRNLHLPEHVSVIDPGCQLPGSIGEIYLRDKNSIVFFWNDMFLNAVRTKSR